MACTLFRHWPDSLCVFMTEVSDFWVILHTNTVYRQRLFVSMRQEFDMFCMLFKVWSLGFVLCEYNLCFVPMKPWYWSRLVFSSREKSVFNSGRCQNLKVLIHQKHVLLVNWEFIGLAQLRLHKFWCFVFWNRVVLLYWGSSSDIILWLCFIKVIHGRVTEL